MILYIMHPALRKGPLFYEKTHPIFHFFTKHPPFYFLIVVVAAAAAAVRDMEPVHSVSRWFVYICETLVPVVVV